MVRIHGITDISIEWIEEVPETNKHKNFRYLFLVLMVTFLAIAFWEGMLGFVLFAIPMLIVFLILNMNRGVEYEFHYYDGQFDIVRIKNKKKRKKVLSTDLDHIEYMADRYAKESRPQPLYDEMREERVSTLFVNGERAREVYAFEADDRFKKIMEVTGKMR